MAHRATRHQRSCDSEHLLLPAGQCAGHLYNPFAQAWKPDEDSLHVGTDRGVIVSQECAHLEILTHGQLREDPPALRTMRDAERQDLSWTGPIDLAALECNPSAREREHPADCFQRRSLAGAVGANQRHQFSFLDRDRNVAQRRHGTVTDGDFLKL